MGGGSLSLNLEFIDLGRLAGKQSLGAFWLCLPGAGLQAGATVSTLLCGLWKIDLRSSQLCGKYFINWDAFQTNI